MNNQHLPSSGKRRRLRRRSNIRNGHSAIEKHNRPNKNGGKLIKLESTEDNTKSWTCLVVGRACNNNG
jgi:hypothetical protein